jgi:hypothetical protein
VAVCKERKLHNSTNFFLISLAIADCMVAIFVMPSSLLVEILGYYPFNTLMCTLWIVLDVLCCTSSIHHMSTLALDRYLTIKFPFKYGRNKSKRITLLKIGAVWLISFCICAPLFVLGLVDKRNVFDTEKRTCMLFNKSFRIYGSIFAFYIPLIIMLVAYASTISILKQVLDKKVDDSKQKINERLRMLQKKTMSNIVEGFLLQTNIAYYANAGNNDSAKMQRSTKNLEASAYDEHGRQEQQIEHSKRRLSKSVNYIDYLRANDDYWHHRKKHKQKQKQTKKHQQEQQKYDDLNDKNDENVFCSSSELNLKHNVRKNSANNSNNSNEISMMGFKHPQLKKHQQHQEQQQQQKQQNSIASNRSNCLSVERALDRRSSKQAAHLRLEQPPARRIRSIEQVKKYIDEEDENDDNDDDDSYTSTAASSSSSSNSLPPRLPPPPPPPLAPKATIESTAAIASVVPKASMNIRQVTMNYLSVNNTRYNEAIGCNLRNSRSLSASLQHTEPRVHVCRKSNSAKSKKEAEKKRTTLADRLTSMSWLHIGGKSIDAAGAGSSGGYQESGSHMSTASASRFTYANYQSIKNVAMNERKALKVLIIIFTVFVTLWSPFFLLNTLSAICETCITQLLAEYESTVHSVLTWLGYLSSMANPIVYTMFNKLFRTAFIDVLTCKKSVSPPSSTYNINVNNIHNFSTRRAKTGNTSSLYRTTRRRGSTLNKRTIGSRRMSSERKASHRRPSYLRHHYYLQQHQQQQHQHQQQQV